MLILSPASEPAGKPITDAVPRHRSVLSLPDLVTLVTPSASCGDLRCAGIRVLPYLDDLILAATTAREA